MKKLRQKFRQLEARIDALSLRERGILFLVILGLLFWIASNVVFASLRSEQQRLEADVRSRLSELQALDQQSQSIKTQLAQDPEAQAQARVDQLKQQLAVDEASVANLIRGLVTPQAMPKLVRDMLANNVGLQVIKLENLPAEPMHEDSNGASASAPVYRHGMRIELRGQYVEIVRYLRALEALPSKVFWGEVQFQSETYPLSRLTLVIYTISLNQSWMGV